MYRYKMADVVSREQFIEACPADLKKRIEDFILFYSQKKKTNGFSGPPETGKKFHKHEGGRFEKKNNNLVGFKKPFDKKVSEFEQVLTDFKGIMSKLNENNQDSIWTEIQALLLNNLTFQPNKLSTRLDQLEIEFCFFVALLTQNALVQQMTKSRDI